MTPKFKSLAIGGAALGAIALSFQLAETGLVASDHLDPPQRTDPEVDSSPDRAADIADLYTFYDDTTTKLVLTFAGPTGPDQGATFDTAVRYYINVSNEKPHTETNVPIRIQFAEDVTLPGNQYGVEVSGLPGVTGSIVGPVETDLQQGGVKVRAGQFDDPFFFDLQGFKETRDTGTLSFDSERDFFAGQNVTGVVIEIPNNQLAMGSNTIDVWAESLRRGGQL